MVTATNRKRSSARKRKPSWTTTPPTSAGWYWCRYTWNRQEARHPCEVYLDKSQGVIVDTGRSIGLLYSKKLAEANCRFGPLIKIPK